MSLDKEINAHIKAAMLAKEEVKLRTLRAIKSAFLLAKTEKGAADKLTEERELKILQKMKKQRQDSVDIYEKSGRSELAKKEIEEIEILDTFLPAQMNDEDLKSVLQEIITKVGASSPKEMGKVMGLATKALSGKADGKRISSLVRTLLSS